MKKNAFLPTLALLFILTSSCGSASSSSSASTDESKSDDTLTESSVTPHESKTGVNLIESFDTFITKFFSDAEFQLTRVIFPVGEYFDFSKGKKVPYTKDDWEKQERYKNIYTNEYDPYEKNSDTSYSLSLEMDGGATLKTFTFNLGEDGKWYLVSIVHI